MQATFADEDARADLVMWIPIVGKGGPLGECPEIECIGWSPEDARQRAEHKRRDLPGYAREYPIVRIARIEIREMAL